jgi:hypothetical protein
MMEPNTIETPTELIHKLYQEDAPLDGAPLMQTAKTTETAPEIISDARTEGGRLTLLVKFVLEVILVYWHTMAYIPKVVLETIKKKCFKFMWTRKRENEGIPLVKWQSLAKPKEVC